ncbi:MAG TPA: peptide deformylase [Acidimicrobiales bacterium]|nr:peptide deformylase [Acidimicrobiales bacterium]
MAAFAIRTYGDPVLRQRASDVADIDASVRRLVDDMIDTMYDAAGLAVAAPQVGVEKRLFVYDLNDDQGPRAMINPVIEELDGEWTYDEGCLSVPGLYFTIRRPKDALVRGVDLDGNELRIEATTLEARMFQHEIEHLDGHLVLERLTPAQRKTAMRVLRERQVTDDRPRRGQSVVINEDGEIVDD